MNQKQLSEAAAMLADYITNLPDFTLVERGEPYGHMGATLTDAILQAGMRYDTQVLPRVRRLLAEHPQAKTSSGFLQLLIQQTPEVIVQIKGRKAHWVQQLASFLVQEQIETEEQLRAWLSIPDHEQRFMALNGVGLKTVNYMKLLVGSQDSVAIDTHLRSFLTAAGVYSGDDRAASTLIAETATILGMTPAQLDSSIWTMVHVQQRQR